MIARIPEHKPIKLVKFTENNNRLIDKAGVGVSLASNGYLVINIRSVKSSQHMDNGRFALENISMMPLWSF